MTEPAVSNFGFMARDLKITPETIEKVSALLDAGLPITFIARFRKEECDGLEETKIRAIAASLDEQRKLQSRKQTILRAIELLGMMNPELEKKILEARTNRRLEDIYLPYKPQKHSHAQAAREKGLEPFALEIFNAEGEAVDLEQRASVLLDPQKGLTQNEDVFGAVRAILCDRLLFNVELRQRVRESIRRYGKLVTKELLRVEAKMSEPESVTASASVETPASVEVPIESAATESVPEVKIPNESPSEETIVSESVLLTPEEPAAEAEMPKIEEPVSELPSETAVPAQEERKIDSERDRAALRATREAERKDRERSQKMKEAEQFRNQFSEYFDASFDIRSCPYNKYLEIVRAEKANVIKVSLEFPYERSRASAIEFAIPEGHPNREFLEKTMDDFLTRLLFPSLEREIRRELLEKSEKQSGQILAKNLRNQLLQRPLNRRRVLSIAPGFAHGCKLVALDEFGNVLAFDTIFMTGSGERRKKAMKKAGDLIEKYRLSVIAIGNGTGSRDAEGLISELLTNRFSSEDIAYTLVNEAGATAYSTSPIAKEEFPGYNSLVRGAISIGRRLQDSLGELVKNDPTNLVIGAHPQDLRLKELREILSVEFESVVSQIGVELNRATPAILKYVPGLNPLTARRIYEYRMEHGPFHRREELGDVPGIGAASFLYASGFLKVTDGYEPLDATWIHPENYPAARAFLEKFGMTSDDLRRESKRRELAEKFSTLDRAVVAQELGIAESLLALFMTEFVEPGRDPRLNLPGQIFKKGKMKIESLQVGMELTGTVLNVVDFGAFIDIGLQQSGLVHISQLGEQFVKDAHQRVAVGDRVTVWVLDVDQKRRRISLTMLRPGTERRVHSVQERNAPEECSQEPLPRNQRTDSAPRSGGNRPERRPSTNADRNRRSEPRRNDRQTPAQKPAASSACEHSESSRADTKRSSSKERFSGGRKEDRRNRTESRPGAFREKKSLEIPSTMSKTIVPISEEMKKGKEPMRSFSDLAQLFGRVQPKEEGK